MIGFSSWRLRYRRQRGYIFLETFRLSHRIWGLILERILSLRLKSRSLILNKDNSFLVWDVRLHVSYAAFTRANRRLFLRRIPLLLLYSICRLHYLWKISFHSLHNSFILGVLSLFLLFLAHLRNLICKRLSLVLLVNLWFRMVRLIAIILAVLLIRTNRVLYLRITRFGLI